MPISLIRRRRGTEDVRQGTGPLDNLVVLIVSLAILAGIGAGLVYFYTGSADRGGGSKPSAAPTRPTDVPGEAQRK